MKGKYQGMLIEVEGERGAQASGETHGGGPHRAPGLHFR